MGNGYITNTDAQQGEDPSRRDSRGPANQKQSIAPRKSDNFIQEGPEEIPEHARPVNPARTNVKPETGLRDPSGASMGDKVKR
jgi:hypothetical protein